MEVEGYLGEQDLAARSSKGLTPRTRILFGPPGFAYVYRIYGIYRCMNIGKSVRLKALTTPGSPLT